MRRKELRHAAALLVERAGAEIECAIILGSGLGGALGAKIPAEPIPYAKIPGMPDELVPGHPGIALVGQIQTRRIVAFAGRFHLYQGYDAEEIAFPVAVAAEAGARTVILTNAAGGLNPDYSVGDFMFIGDHINLSGHNPLTGTRMAARGEAFVDMGETYAPLLRERAQSVATGQGLRTQVGTYAGVPGPSFETPAETRMLRMLGADAVGMSTVLEAIAARAFGLQVLGISLITNVLDGTSASTHENVLGVSHAYAARFANLIEGTIATFDR